MYACPTCQARSISLFRKWLSYPTLPAYCPVCRSYSHTHRSSGGVGLVVAAFVITGFGIAASALQAAWPLGLGVALALGFSLWRVHRVPLEPLSPAMVSLARKSEAMGWFVLLMTALMS